MKPNEKGFSLLEIMLVMLISSVIFYALAAGMRNGDEQIGSANVRMDLQESAREGLYRMVQELRQSAPSRVTIGAAGDSVQFQVPDPASPVNAAYTIDWDNSRNITYTFNQNNQQVIRTDLSTGLTRVVANDVTAVSFSGNAANPSLVTITLSVQRALINGKLVPNPALQLSAQAEVRNV